MYDSFGNILATTGTLTNSFRYTGREFDTETSLYYYRARYYDATSGRFIGEDPFRFRAGVDFYAYVLNNPVLYVDPHGFESGDLNKLVPGPNGETAKNVPCPDCLEKMYRVLQKDILEAQQKAGKPGCVVVCSTIGFADDAAAVGVGLFRGRFALGSEVQQANW